MSFLWEYSLTGASKLPAFVIGANNIAISGTSWIYSTTDGLTWTQITNPLPAVNYFSIAASNSAVVAVGWNTANTGNTAAIISSTDGVNFVSRSFPNSSNTYFITNVAYGNGIFCVMGANTSSPLLWTSSDGITWTSQTPPKVNSVYYTKDSAVFWDNTIGKFLIPDLEYDTPQIQIWTSSDGITWANNNQFLSAVQYSMLYPTGGNFYWSTETDGYGDDALYYTTNINNAKAGSGWTNISNSIQNYVPIVYGNGVYVSPNSGVTSSDGVTWSSTFTRFPVYNNRMYYYNPMNDAGYNLITSRSTYQPYIGGGYNNIWIGFSNTLSSFLFQSSYANNMYHIKTSTNGTTWSNTPFFAAPTANTTSFSNTIITGIT